MSRVGRKPINIPAGVEFKLENTSEGSAVSVKGPKGNMSRTFHKDIMIKVNENVVTVERPSDHRTHRALHGTTRSLVANMVQGVHEGFSKTLELVGVGYRAAKKGNNLVLTVGYSHPVEIAPEEGITIDVPSQTQVVVQGIDKQRVGEVAAGIRDVRRPEPYKGKGIRYQNEVVRRKEGKKGE